MPQFPSSRLWYSLPWSIALGLAILHSLLPSLWVAELGPWLFLASMVFLGLPHGAADFLVAGKILPERYFPGTFLALYSALFLTILFLWGLAPAIALGLFLILTAWHWGSAELYPLPGAKDRPARTWQSLTRGGWVMAIPFALHPEETLNIIAVWDIDQASLPPMEIWPWLCGFLLLADIGLCWQVVPRRFRVLYSFEVLYLGFIAILLTPLWWITLYFLFFHAWRHTLRIRDRFFTPREKGLLPLLSLITLRYAPMILLLLLFFGLLIILGQDELVRDPLAWTGTYIAFLAALTVPHSILIRYWDHLEKSGRPM